MCLILTCCNNLCSALINFPSPTRRVHLHQHREEDEGFYLNSLCGNGWSGIEMEFKCSINIRVNILGILLNRKSVKSNDFQDRLAFPHTAHGQRDTEMFSSTYIIG